MTRTVSRPHSEYQDTMDAEHLNQIGTQIEDLRSRTAELRGYL